MTIAGWRAPIRADPAPDFLELARAAIGTPDALARVQALHVVLTVRSEEPDEPNALSSGGRMTRAESQAPKRIPTLQLWLAPPSRFLMRENRFSYGFDGRRLIGVNPPWLPANAPADRYSFLHWTMALLLYDPHAIGVTVHDLGADLIGKKTVHVLQATAGDSDFNVRMYFDADSHRLLRTDGIRMSTEIGRFGDPQIAYEIPERDSYGGYRRVGGLELPFTIMRDIRDGQGSMAILDVVNYEINPKNLDKQFAP